MVKRDVGSAGCESQLQRLRMLRDPAHRRALLERIEERRRVPAHESEHRRPRDPEGRTRYRFGDGIARPTLRVVDPQNDERDPVLIVRDELFVATAELERALELLDGQFAPARTSIDAEVERLCEELGRPAATTRLVATQTAERSEVDAVRLLRAQGLDAGPNHVGMLSGRDKSGCTPEPTDVKLGTRPACATDGTLVVVIDTGVDEDARFRTDGWLDGAAPLAVPDDHDLLDRVDVDGQPISDGYLDRGAGHGTFVAGIIRQESPTAVVRIVRALNTEGDGTEDQIACAIYRAAALFKRHGRPGVLNLSLGMETLDGEEPTTLRAAVQSLPEDVLVVAAAGNARTGIELYPAAFDDVIAVSSHQGDEALTASTWANRADWVDFSAAGECVVSTFVNGEEVQGQPGDPLHDPDPDAFLDDDQAALWTGTSFAAPQVAGRLAELLTAGLTGPAAVEALEHQTMSVFEAGYGHKLPNTG